MIQPTIDQLRNLTDRAATGLTADEQQRLRDGIDQLAHATDSELRRQLADTIHALGRSETELAGVRALRDRWLAAGPPPLGTSINRWWDRRLAELGAALQPAEDTGPMTTPPGPRPITQTEAAAINTARLTPGTRIDRAAIDEARRRQGETQEQPGPA